MVGVYKVMKAGAEVYMYLHLPNTTALEIED